MKRAAWLAFLAFPLAFHAPGQVIEYESNGLKYQTLTKAGVTVIFTTLPNPVHHYSVMQVSVSNGSESPYVIRPEDFSYARNDGTRLRAEPSKTVVTVLLQKASGHDVVKLMNVYEASVYGGHLQTTNGFETRRQAAQAISAGKVRAAAAASALALVQTRLMRGESTDGAVFFTTDGKPLGPGHLVVRTNTDVFEFLPSFD
jgi:hypothetical protein